MEKYDNQLETEAILDLDSIATIATEMGISDFSGNLLILIAAEKGYDNGPQKVVFKRHTGSLLVAIGDFTKTDDFDVKTFKVLDREMSYTTFNDGVVFDIPIESEVQDNSERMRAAILNSKKETTQPQKETSATEENKDQGEATKHGPALTVEEITGILIDLGVSENDVKESFVHLPTKLAIGKLPNVTIHRVDDKITLTYGNTEKATLLDKAAAQDARLPDSMRLSPEEIRYEAFHDVVNQSGLYIYTVSPKEEAKMSNEQNPTDADLVWKKLRQQLEAAKLSQQSIDGIMHTLRHDAGLKKPTEESVLANTQQRIIKHLNADNPKETVPMEEIVSRLKELDIDSSWINFFVEYASMNGFKVSLPEPRLTAAKDKVYITFGDPDSAASAGFSKLKLDAWKSAIEWAIDERGGVFHIPRTKANETENDTSGVQDRQCDLSSPQSTQPKKEDKMASLPKTIDQILKDAYCQRMQQAGLSDDAVAFILGEIFHSKVLKAPKEDSSFVVVAGKYISNIYYSFDNGSVTLTDAEATLVTQSGELIGYGIGITNAFFAIDTSNTRDKLIYRHLGTPQTQAVSF